MKKKETFSIMKKILIQQYMSMMGFNKPASYALKQIVFECTLFVYSLLTLRHPSVVRQCVIDAALKQKDFVKQIIQNK